MVDDPNAVVVVLVSPSAEQHGAEAVAADLDTGPAERGSFHVRDPTPMEPKATRPHMPDYGIKGPTEGTGLLPWSWAVERLTASHDYWVATTWPDGLPHVTPVWGAWVDDAVWFSCGPNSAKARNLARDPRCSIATDKPSEPGVLDGTATPSPGRALAQSRA